LSAMKNGWPERKAIPQGIDQTWRDIVGHVGKTRGEIGLPVKQSFVLVASAAANRNPKRMNEEKYKASLVFHCTASLSGISVYNKRG